MKKIFDHIEEYIGGTLFIIMFVVLIIQILARQLFDKPLMWSEELARFLFVYIGYLGVSAGIKEGNHVAIDFFVEKFPHKIQRYLHFFFQGLIAAILVIMFMIGMKMTIRKIPVPIVSLQISYMYMYMALPITALLMIYRLIERNIKELKNRQSV